MTIAVNRNLSNCEIARKKVFRGFNGIRMFTSFHSVLLFCSFNCQKRRYVLKGWGNRPFKSVKSWRSCRLARSAIFVYKSSSVRALEVEPLRHEFACAVKNKKRMSLRWLPRDFTIKSNYTNWHELQKKL